MLDIREYIVNGIVVAIKAFAEAKGVDYSSLPEIKIERPRRPEMGDWASSAAMQSAKIFGLQPKVIAEALVENLRKDVYFSDVTIAGAGFINFKLSRKWLDDMLREILVESDKYGRTSIGRNKKVQVEFVSANPTGPLHVGHGRGAAVGDVTAAVLEFAGYDVQREYYVNDAGLQMELLGRSTQARYFEILGDADKCPFPSDGYKGDYIYDIARLVIEKHRDEFLKKNPEDSLPFFKKFTGDLILDGIKDDLDVFGVKFDKWFSELSLYERDSDKLTQVDKAINWLKERDYAYDHEGAVWFAATKFGDEKDRVLIRSNGKPTYFASDIAYHYNKFIERRFHNVIDVWGADHHGYVPRMKAAIQAMGFTPDSFEVILIQFVNLLRGGQQVSMSTRSGEFVTLREVIDEVGKDAARFMFLYRRSDSHLDFDLEVAKSQSMNNPVYYVQYAHARIKSIFREEGEDVVEKLVVSADLTLLQEEEEKAIVRRLILFPEEIEKAALELAPHRVAFYLYELAGDFHAFYNKHRVRVADDGIKKARFALLKAVLIVIVNGLSILKVSAPEKM